MDKGKNKNDFEGLNAVSKTNFALIYAKANESMKDNPKLYDQKSLDILNTTQYKLPEYPSFIKAFPSFLEDLMQMVVINRTRIIDSACKEFLDNNLESIVVNLGAGLDTRLSRLDNGKVTWYDLDLPEMIDARRCFFKESQRNIFISQSCLDYSWMDLIPKNKPTMFIAEGLFLYFEKAELKGLMSEIASKFPGSEMLIDSIGPLLTKMNIHPSMEGNTLKFKWGVSRFNDILGWHNSLELIKETSVIDLEPKVYKWARHSLRKYVFNKIGHLKV